MPLLRAAGIGKSFNGKVVLHDLSLTVDRGEAVCILGESGCGKTTLLRCLNLLEHIDTGFIEYNGQRIIESAEPSLSRYGLLRRQRRAYRLRVNEDEFRKHFGVVFQAYNLFPNRTVLENMLEGPVYVLGQPPKEAACVARQLLDAVGITGREASYPHELSGGEQQRVAIARSLAMRPEILLLDEVTSALDPPRVAGLLAIIRKLRADNETAMVIVTHHVDFARDVADRIYFLDRGQLVEEGSPDEVLVRPETSQFRAFLESVRAGR